MPEAGVVTQTQTTQDQNHYENENCEDDRRLLGAELVINIGRGRVFDMEENVIRRMRLGCDE